MRFILNFIFFGMIFYLIHLFFPDAFMKIVDGADQVYLFCKSFVQQVIDGMNNAGGSANPPPQ